MAALEQPKKPVGGAYGIFLSEKRPEYTKACAGQKASAISQMAGENWKKISDADKKPYQKKYEAVKAKYDTEMAAFLAAGGEKQKGALALRAEKRKAKEGGGKAKEGGGKAKKDPNAPKKPAGGGYGQFLAEKRPEFTKACAGQSVTAISKMAGDAWKALSADAKKPYETKYAAKSEEYKKAIAEYKKNNPDADEDGEEEQESASEDETKKPAAKKAKTAPLSGDVAAEAKRIGFERQFKSLSDNPNLANTPASKILAALTAAGGAVVAARKALYSA